MIFPVFIFLPPAKRPKVRFEVRFHKGNHFPVVTGFPDNFASISAVADFILATVPASRNEGRSASALSSAPRAAAIAACLTTSQSSKHRRRGHGFELYQPLINFGGGEGRFQMGLGGALGSAVAGDSGVWAGPLATRPMRAPKIPERPRAMFPPAAGASPPGPRGWLAGGGRMPATAAKRFSRTCAGEKFSSCR